MSFSKLAIFEFLKQRKPFKNVLLESYQFKIVAVVMLGGGGAGGAPTFIWMKCAVQDVTAVMFLTSINRVI